MNPRPRSITIISWVFIAFGSVAILANVVPVARPAAGQRLADVATQNLSELWPLYLSQIAAVTSGVFMLRGSNWARWLLVAWFVFHVALSFLHSPVRVVVHALLLGAALYYLFRRPAAAYFRGAPGGRPPPRGADDTRTA